MKIWSNKKAEDLENSGSRVGNVSGRTIRFLFSAYTAVMIYLLFFRRISSYNALPYGEYMQLYTNFYPFETLKRFFYLFTQYRGKVPYFVKIAFVNLAGNVVLFVPLGIFLPAIWKVQRKLPVFILSVILLISLVEIMQFMTRLGSCDIDDLILNLLGALIGFVGMRIFAASGKSKT